MTSQTTTVTHNSIASQTSRRPPSLWLRALRDLSRNPGGLVGVVFVVAVIVCALFAPWIAPHDPSSGSVLNRLSPPAWQPGGDSHFLLGTDTVGRDVLSRIIFGSRISLLIGVLSVCISMSIGVPVGLIAGFYRGWVDDVLMRIVDIVMTFPFILFAILVMALFGPGVNKLIIVLGVTGWVSYARVVRAQVLSLREQEYVMSAVIAGASDVRLLVKHILPGVWAPIIVIATMEVAVNILLSSGLSFLGLGVDPSIPDWGGMLASGQLYLTSAWWVETFPGMAIFLTVLGFNLLGDWLRDVMDVRT